MADLSPFTSTKDGTTWYFERVDVIDGLWRLCARRHEDKMLLVVRHPYSISFTGQDPIAPENVDVYTSSVDGPQHQERDSRLLRFLSVTYSS